MTSTEKIRALNDDLRTLRGEGRICVTTGIARLEDTQQAEIMQRVFTYRDFRPRNDPYGEHAFGSFEYAGMWIMWKIDYYDRTCEWGSPDPANPAVTTRVLTVMLAEEY